MKRKIVIRHLSRPPKPKKYFESLEYQLTATLAQHCGERGYTEGAVDTLERIIRERDQALAILALDRLRNEPRL